jgi:hypothetical protein
MSDLFFTTLYAYVLQLISITFAIVCKQLSLVMAIYPVNSGPLWLLFDVAPPILFVCSLTLWSHSLWKMHDFVSSSFAIFLDDF